MDQFSYLSVLLSIILGLGITHLLTSLGRVVVARSRIAFYWPSIAWIAVLLVIHVQTWWSMFGMRDYPDWNFFVFLLVAMQPVLLYLIAALVLPEIPNHGAIDLKAHYFDNTRWFFGTFIALLAVSVLKDLAMHGKLPDPLNLGFHALFLLSSAIAMSTRKAWFHMASPLAVGAVLVVYIVALFARLQ